LTLSDEEIAEIRTLQDKVQEAFDILYSSTCKFKRVKFSLPKRKVFTWFEFYLNRAEGMVDLLVNQTKNLVALNTEKTQALLVKYCRDKQIEAVRQLQMYPNIQYEFLKNLIAEKNFSYLSNEVKLIYVEIMCQIEPYKVGEELMTLEVPLEESLEICMKYKNMEGIIVIIERLGKIEESAYTFLEVLAPLNHSGTERKDT
jgi:hypothetical protein